MFVKVSRKIDGLTMNFRLSDIVGYGGDGQKGYIEVRRMIDGCETTHDIDVVESESKLDKMIKERIEELE